jgi:hypothetical protein
MTPTVDKSFHAACEQLRADEVWVVYPGSESYPHSSGLTVIGVRELASKLAEDNPGLGDLFSRKAPWET